jgi:hypothetical protein
MKSINILISASFLLSPTFVLAEVDCSNFRKPSQARFEKTPEGVKIVVVAEIPVSFDDVRVVRRARQRAELEAKNQIVNFIEQELSNEQKVKEAAQETASLGDSDGVKASYDEVIEAGMALSGKGKAVLRGVVPIDECYTPGKYIRVSYGLKPETIAGAGRLAGDINKSLNQNPTRKVGSPDVANSANAGSGNSKGEPTAPQDNRQVRELNRMPGYGGSGATEKF